MTRCTWYIFIPVLYVFEYNVFVLGEEFVIEPGIRIIPTPGHTATDVSVLVDTESLGLVAVTGDLFEREEDLTDPSLWRDLGGSENPELQQANREKILAIADYIVPGHGPMFKNILKTPVVTSATDQAAGSSSAY
jgi:glyoxylase-like metal-dependent hydrolase (beta-lactamase superfamily II)